MPDSNLTGPNRTLYFSLYLFTLLLLFGASFLPNYNIWGMNLWSFLPLFTKIIFLLIVLGVLLMLWIRPLPEQTAGVANSFYLIAGGLILVLGGLFYFFRAKTYFLGDGYSLLGNMALDSPLVKERNLGEALAHLQLKNLIGGDPKNAALLSYQFISYASGILTLIVTSIFAGTVFKNNLKRILFLLGVASGGYMLLAFGYVEHYSIFTLAVIIFTYLGVLTMLGKINRFWLILSFIFALFNHIFGIILLPALIYLLFANTKISRKIGSLSFIIKLILSLIVSASAVALFLYFYNNSYFIRFAVLPVFANQFTVDGYTLFSLKHFVDLFNLYFMLLPGLLLMIYACFRFRKDKSRWTPELIFLSILSLSTFGAVFIFDPKLGFPRDWDLFAFSAIPPLILFYYLLLKSEKKHLLEIAILSITLGFWVLAPRVYALHDSDTAIKQFKYYSQLAPIKNRLDQVHLINYYNNIGDSATAKTERENAIGNFPEEKLVNQAREKFYNGNYSEATKLVREALAINPVYVDAYNALGEFALDRQNFSNALENFKISEGLNGGEFFVYNNIGVTDIALKNYREAEKYLYQALRAKPNAIEAVVNLMRLYIETNRVDKFKEKIELLASFEQANYQMFYQIGDYCQHFNKDEMAAIAFETAKAFAVDSTKIDGQ